MSHTIFMLLKASIMHLVQQLKNNQGQIPTLVYLYYLCLPHFIENYKDKNVFDMIKFFLQGFHADSSFFIKLIEQDLEMTEETKSFLRVMMQIHQGHPEKYEKLKEMVGEI